MVIRLVSAFVGAIIAVIILIFHNTIALNIAIGIISVIMMYELLKAAKCIKFRLTCIPAFIFVGISPFFITGRLSAYRNIILIAVILFIFATYIIQHKTLKYFRLMFIISAMLLISMSMGCLIALNSASSVHGLMYLIMGLCGAWLADSGAYFAGTFLGKRKLCPEVSPKKTVEGFIGGIVVTGLLFMLINFAYSKILPSVSDNSVEINYLAVGLIGMILAVVGTIGDLSASVLKRQCGIKDYGNIMPGHGGLMDRFDSVIFVAPCLFALLQVFSIYK